MINNYLVTIIIGIFLVILISILVSKLSKKNSKIKTMFTESDNFDERQIASRLLSYKFGYIAFTICLFTLFFVLFLCMTFLGYIPDFFSPLVITGIVIFIGTITFCITAIWNDAFISFKDKKKNPTVFNIIFFLVLGVIALGDAIYRINIPLAKVSTTLSFIAAIFCISVSVNVFIKMLIDNKQNKEDKE